jgi:hypothetical protein
VTTRRKFITLLGGAVAWPLAARAQSSPQRRVGVLMNGPATDAELQSHLAAFCMDCGNWGGSKAKTSASIFAGPPAMPRLYRITRRS